MQDFEFFHREKTKTIKIHVKNLFLNKYLDKTSKKVSFFFIIFERKLLHENFKKYNRPRGVMANASDFESEDCGFESHRGRCFLLVEDLGGSFFGVLEIYVYLKKCIYLF